MTRTSSIILLNFYSSAGNRVGSTKDTISFNVIYTNAFAYGAIAVGVQTKPATILVIISLMIS